MATNPDDIRLTRQQQELIAEIVDQTAIPWTVILQDAIEGFALTLANSESGQPSRTLYDAFAAKGLVGCIRSGREQLRSDSEMMEGFGKDAWPADSE